MKQKIKSISYILLLYILNSCGYNCPGFLDDNLGWIPYIKEENFSYTSGEEVLTFKVIDYYKTKPTSHEGLAMDFECEDEGYYKTNKQENYFVYERYSYGWNYKDPGMKIQLTNNDIFLFDLIHKTAYSDSMSVKFLSDTIIENCQFQEIFIIEKTKMKEPEQILWLMKAKDKGIVQFHDRYSGKTWTLK